MRRPTRSEILLYTILCVFAEIVLLVILVREIGFDFVPIGIGLGAGAVGALLAVPFGHAVRLQMLGDGEDRWSK